MEHGPLRVSPLECSRDVEQRGRRQSRGGGRHEPVSVFGPGHHGPSADHDHQPGGANRTPRASAITGSTGGRGLRPMRSGRRRVETQAEGQDHVDREVDPEDLQRKEWSPVGDVEDPGADEGENEPRQHDHLQPDVLHQVVVEPSPPLDRGNDGREVVVGQDHLRRILGDLGAGDTHRHADVGPGESRRLVHAVPGHRDDVALLLQHTDQTHLVLGRDPRDHPDVIDVGLQGAFRRTGLRTRHR